MTERDYVEETLAKMPQTNQYDILLSRAGSMVDLESTDEGRVNANEVKSNKVKMRNGVVQNPTTQGIEL